MHSDYYDISSTAKEILDIGEDLSTVIGKTFPIQTERIIKPITKKAIEKSIRPSVVKGRTAQQAKQFFDKANDSKKTYIIQMVQAKADVAAMKDCLEDIGL